METDPKLVLVTGATGQQGGAVARELLGKRYRVRAMTRRPDSGPAGELVKSGAEVVAGDLDDAASLERASRGAWGVFAVQNTWEAGVEREEEQGKRLAEVARRQGVQHFVYSSVASAHRHTGIPHFENKARVEDRVRSLGFPSHVVLRPVFFMENFASPWFVDALRQGQLTLGTAPGTVLQMIAVRDIGRYGLWAFERHAELNGRAFDIAGDQHTMPEAARILGQAIHREVKHVPTPIEEVRKASADFATMLEWFDRVGYDADIAHHSRASGIPPTSLAEWASSINWAPVAAAR